VYIRYAQDKEHCHLIIRNNGAQNSMGQVNTGQGLKNIKMRAEQLKGTAVVNNVNDVFEVIVNL